jgi:hypothetical protein
MASRPPAPPPPAQRAQAAQATSFLAMVNEVDIQIDELDRRITLATREVESLIAASKKKSGEKTALEQKLEQKKFEYENLRTTLIQAEQTRDVFANSEPRLRAQRTKLTAISQRVDKAFRQAQ